MCVFMPYRCMVDWDDPQFQPTVKFVKNLLPCQLTNDYEKVNSHYTIHAWYCSATREASTGDIKVGPCASPYIRSIDTSYDPANPLNFSITHGEL